ncbi:ATPase [candidate division KSB3 bacterium]|uniref:ATPase n=1 Tax=candidate division KSB3 bacterium TaxID=2044937 RepID=A0A2G6E4B8_9BACT|nr:MAG: ATPase [candidate division KSB3 bacterium]PIE29362.1 MAG: ATPase [candidate division KSB3 bacterium]
MNERVREIGTVTCGSLTEGIEMRLAPCQSIEDVKAGKFVVIEGRKNDFFSMITDVRLDTANRQIVLHPPERGDMLMREVLSGTSAYATILLRPMLMVPKEGNGEERTEVLPVKTIPEHFSNVFDASEDDVNQIFGDEAASGGKYFFLGTPLDMETPVCLNLDRFVERSNGIFGKTGTGKTFLTRLVLCGLVKQEKAVNFIFDMHSEYGWQATQEAGKGKGSFVKGLKQLFGSRVAIFTLDPESTRRRNVQADREVQIFTNQIAVEDIAPLQDELRLNPTAVEAAYLIVAKYGKNWLEILITRGEKDIKGLADELGAHPESLSALYRKLRRLTDFDFITMGGSSEDIVSTMMDYINRGIHIVLEFGRETSMLAYLLVAGIITRRIHELYVKQTEIYHASQDSADKPKHLVITIEEAHKFLNPHTAKQTIFGIIAREMRKYFVSLLIVDQRPSGIDDEVISQVGTRIVALLNDEKDIQSVLTGVNNVGGLRSVLASLDSKQQALVMGHAVPMPVVVRTRNYDQQFYNDMGFLSQDEQDRRAMQDEEDVFG